VDDIRDYQSGADNTNEAVEAIRTHEINLLEYLFAIYKYRWMIALICVVAVAAAVLYSLSLPKIYSATASVIPPLDVLQMESATPDRLKAMRSSMLIDATGVSSITDMYKGILKSGAVIDAIIDRFNLMEVYEESQYRSNVRARLRNCTTIEIKEGIVNITVEDESPERAAALANAYVAELDRQNKRLSSGQATSKRIFMENRFKEIEKELSNIENIPAKQAQIKEMLYEMLSRECELARIEEAKSMPTIQVLDEAIVPEKKCKPNRRQIVKLYGATALFCSILLAFAREYFSQLKNNHIQGRNGLPTNAKQDEEDSRIGEVQDRRRIVSALRRKRSPEDKTQRLNLTKADE
jgi:uncharacterized protein involved in exopolysaccharide biosynthesis